MPSLSRRRANRLRRSAALATVGLVLAAGILGCAAPETPDTSERAPAMTANSDPTGLTPTGAAATAATLARLAEDVSPERIESTLKALLRHPSVAGGPRSRESAETLRQALAVAGLDARVDAFDVLLPHPMDTGAELLAPFAFRPSATAVPDDRDLSTHAAALPPFVAFSPDGDVTGAVVYGNRGSAADFEALGGRVALGGRIAVLRFGGPDVASKVRNAHAAGLAAVVIYPDPADDGFRRADPYPKGPARPESAARRATALDANLPGDPLTPGRAAMPSAAREALGAISGVAPIPVVSLSARDASPFLACLTGPTAPAAWQGGLPFTYHLGGAETALARVHVSSDWRRRPIYDVVGVLAGSVWPDETILVGAARDGFVHGATVPGTATAALAEAARLLADAAKSGSPPSRTIVFCAFDGEQFGRLGSTEFLEAGRGLDELMAFVEVGPVHDGPLLLSTVPLLIAPVRTLLGTLAPLQTRFVLDATAPEPPTDTADRDRGAGAHGFTSRGVPYVLLESAETCPVRHSVFDTFGYVRKFGDPGFSRTSALAVDVATLALGLANSGIFPYDVSSAVARWQATYATLDTSTLAATPWGDPLRTPPISLHEAILSGLTNLRVEAEAFAAARSRFLATDPDPLSLRGLNQRLGNVIRTLGTPTRGGTPGVHAPHPEHPRRLTTLEGLARSPRDGALEIAAADDLVTKSTTATEALRALREALESAERTMPR